VCTFFAPHFLSISIRYQNCPLRPFSSTKLTLYIFPAVILEKLLSQENRVLEYWTSKKKRLDQNQQYCLFERSARQSLAWIKEEGDIYLTTHTKVGATKEETEKLLAEHNSFKVRALTGSSQPIKEPVVSRKRNCNFFF
jgi:hypothetical protein